MARGLGSWAFLIGVILAVILGIVQGSTQASWAAAVLMVIGLIVGLLNITEKEVGPFLMAGAVLVIVSWMSGPTFGSLGDPLGKWLTGIFAGLMSLFVPATIIVAIKSVFGMARG